MKVFFIPTHFLTTIGFVLVIYLDELISVCNERHYRLSWEFRLLSFSLSLHATAASSSGLALRADRIRFFL